jgi:hypothetical protein
MRRPIIYLGIFFATLTLCSLPINQVVGYVNVQDEIEKTLDIYKVTEGYEPQSIGFLIKLIIKLMILLISPGLLSIVIAMMIYIYVSNMIGPPDPALINTSPLHPVKII